VTRSSGEDNRWVMALTAAGFVSSVAVAICVIRGEYTAPRGPETWALAAMAVLVVLIVTMGVAYFVAGRASRGLVVAQAVAWVLMVRVAIDATGGSISPLYPFVYVFAALAGAYVPVVYASLGILVFVATEGGQSYMSGPWPESVPILTAHAAGLLAVTGIVSAFFSSERKRSMALEEELAVYRRGQAAFNENADEFRSIREEGRREQLRESVVRLQDALHHTLSDLYDIIKPNTCILFTRDSAIQKMCFRDALSATEQLDRAAQIGEGEGLLGWVWREREALRLTTFHHPPENLVYYRKDEAVQSLLAVPVIRNGSGTVEGILVVDSLQEGYFTTEDERLVWLAARQVIKELETAEQRRREINEARVSHALYKASEALNSSIDLDEVLDATMTCIAKIVDADLAALALFDHEAGVSKVVRALGNEAPGIKGKMFEPDESLVGWVTTPEQYLFYPDFSKRRIQKPVFGKNFPLIKGIGTFFCYPLVSGSEFLGSITIIFGEELGIGDYERNAVTTTARMAATSIANANLHHRVAQMATTDGLTRLFNHRYFQERLNERVEEARRHPTRHTLIMVDIDHFKKVNDTYGHPIGDEVLRAMARLLKESVRNIDLAARYGGEEFVLILVNTRLDGAVSLAERIRKQASKLKFEAEDQIFKVTVSMGVATFPDDARSKQALIEHADQALYYAKNNGRNQVVAYSEIAEEIDHKPILVQQS